MQISFDHLLHRAQTWAKQLIVEQWLTPYEIQPLLDLQNRTPASLFEAGVHRPLVAAFFGGTGVGKSTLLNRLAGQAIARTGVERPTSREISLYLHESIELRHLPKNFPIDRVRMAYHQNDSRRQVLWIDMPDIDSIEQEHREWVLEWLPHIDVLIYVVNPERYRDDKGWRLLQAYGCEHAWLFVINQWDRGHTAQYEDFSKLLSKAGFKDPIILCTDSREAEAVRKPDDFEQLKGFLQEMADRHVMNQLEIRAETVRLETLQVALHYCLDKLGGPEGYEALPSVWSEQWGITSRDLLKGAEWPIQNVARAFVGHEVNPLLKRIVLTPVATSESSPPKPYPPSALWDEWAQSQFQDAIDRLIVAAGDRQLPVIPLKTAMEPLFQICHRLVLDEGQRSLRQALANPGNVVQRIMLKFAGLMTVLLPLVAIAWVSFQVVKGYYESALNHLAYLGIDFAVHSVLLIVLSWLLPYFLYRKFKPSTERIAIQGLRSGVQLGLQRAGERIVDALQTLEEKRRRLNDEGSDIMALSASVLESPAYLDSSLLRRVLPSGNAGGFPLSGPATRVSKS